MRIAKSTLLSLAVGSMVLLAARRPGPSKAALELRLRHRTHGGHTCCGARARSDGTAPATRRTLPLSGSAASSTPLRRHVETALFVRQCVGASERLLRGQEVLRHEGALRGGRDDARTRTSQSVRRPQSGLLSYEPRRREGGGAGDGRAAQNVGRRQAQRRDRRPTVPTGTEGLKVFAVIAKELDRHTDREPRRRLDRLDHHAALRRTARRRSSATARDESSTVPTQATSSSRKAATTSSTPRPATTASAAVPGDDTIAGGDGDDRLFGGAARTRCGATATTICSTAPATTTRSTAASGNDKLRGGTGVDTCFTATPAPTSRRSASCRSSFRLGLQRSEGTRPRGRSATPCEDTSSS